MTWNSEDNVHVVWTFWVFFTEILWFSALVSAKLDRLSNQGTENGRTPNDDWTWARLSAGCCFSTERLHLSRDPRPLVSERNMLPSAAANQVDDCCALDRHQSSTEGRKYQPGADGRGTLVLLINAANEEEQNNIRGKRGENEESGTLYTHVGLVAAGR